MEMDLVGIKNQNEYYTNHYFTSIFEDNAEDTIKGWKTREKEEEIQLPWKRLRDISRQYYRIRERYQISKNENNSKAQVQELAELYLSALGYEDRNSVTVQVADSITVPIFHEETKVNGAPLLWAFLCVAKERGDDILQGKIFEKSDDEEEAGKAVEYNNDDILAKLFFAGEEAPRFIMFIGINQIALIDRNKWNEKRYLQFMMEDIYSRHEESTFMAMTVLLHRESLCSKGGTCILDSLDENSHKHSAGVSDALKYALRECIEILGNEVIYDMKTRQGIDLSQNPVDASELTLECLRYMYRFLFMLFIEARPELGYAPMKSQTYVQGYSLEGLRDVCDRVKEESEVVSEGYYIDDTISKLFRMIYEGYPGDLDAYKKALEQDSLHDVFTIEALKAHIFDPEYTKLITKAKLRNSAMLQIVDLMSISRPAGKNERKGRISYSALGINQMGAVYEALLSYRGFIAEEILFEVKRKGEKFNELDVGYFIPERELDNYEEDERVRYEKGEQKGQLRKYEEGTFIYRLAGREREKSASYYTPEVLTKCLVKYALKELLKNKTADEILNLTICEPAMGSAAFLNEAINQLAESYLNKKQEELGETISYDQRFEELQKVKMFIADRNVYGVDLNPIAVELAEVSLWLNTIYKGAYVPWFGTQLVCGNSLIGARRQVYSQFRLEVGKWWENAPTRIMPGETRTRKGQHETTKGIYHFLLGDPGMANYTDKVIKGLEPDNIKTINNWRKEFTAKYDENDIQTLLSLSESIDDLWSRTVELRKKVKEATFEPLSVFGHDESEAGSHTTIREKDEIYKKLFKSEHMNNAGPYARLKAAMDYWCALWFWPIDKADLLPDRQTFFFEMSLLLEGTLNAVSTNASGQMSFIDSSGNALYDEAGNLNYIVEGSQIALEFRSQYATLGRVNLDELSAKHERLAIVNQIAEQQRFQHWELEFADVFEDNGGFDLMIGNPPWLKMTWNEQAVLSDRHPILAIKKLSAADTAKQRMSALDNLATYKMYFDEYKSMSGTQNFLNAYQNYWLLKGQQTNLYKCFIPNSWMYGNTTGVSAFIHPDGVFDDPNGETLRKKLYPRLRKHFQFTNEMRLFAEVDHHMGFSLNTYLNKETEDFDVISNLFITSTIDECYENDGTGIVPGIKNDEGNWETKGHARRIIHVGKEELLIFSILFDGNTKWEQARLPVIHAKDYLDVLKCFAAQKVNIGKLGNKVDSSEMWHEANDQKSGIIVRDVHFPKEKCDAIFSGPHIGVANPLFKSSRRECVLNSDFDNIYLDTIPEAYIQRINYSIGDVDEYNKRITKSPWGIKFNEQYMVCSRKMLNLTGERTLVTAIIPPKTAFINGLFGMTFSQDTAVIAGSMASIPYDFYLRVTGKSNGRYDTFASFPVLSNSKYSKMIAKRALMLNCLTSNYIELWEKEYDESFVTDDWAKKDIRLDSNRFLNVSSKWSYELPLRTDYERREALVELDVLVALELGMTLEQLKTIYRIQFPVLQGYEADTWYDVNGQIVFTNNRSMNNIGFSRKEWENDIMGSHDGTVFERIVIDDNFPDGTIERIIKYTAPFIKCNRENDYQEIWNAFEKRIGKHN